MRNRCSCASSNTICAQRRDNPKNLERNHHPRKHRPPVVLQTRRPADLGVENNTTSKGLRPATHAIGAALVAQISAGCLRLVLRPASQRWLFKSLVMLVVRRYSAQPQGRCTTLAQKIGATRTNHKRWRARVKHYATCAEQHKCHTRWSKKAGPSVLGSFYGTRIHG